MTADGAWLLASYEPAWCEEGLGADAVHVEVHGADPADLEALLGLGLSTRLEPALLRVDPSVELATFRALLEAGGWRVEEVMERVLLARR